MDRKEVIELAISHAIGAIDQFNPADEYHTIYSYRDNIVDCMHEAKVTDPILWDLALATYTKRVNWLARRAKLGIVFQG